MTPLRTGIALMAFGFAIARFGLFLSQIAAAGGVALRRRLICLTIMKMMSARITKLSATVRKLP